MKVNTIFLAFLLSVQAARVNVTPSDSMVEYDTVTDEDFEILSIVKPEDTASTNRVASPSNNGAELSGSNLGGTSSNSEAESVREAIAELNVKSPLPAVTMNAFSTYQSYFETLKASRPILKYSLESEQGTALLSLQTLLFENLNRGNNNKSKVIILSPFKLARNAKRT